MSRRYTPEQKADLLARLQANNYDITLTHMQTGVPERTIREWRRVAWLEGQLPPPTPLQRQQETLPEFEDYGAELSFLRGNIMQELHQLARSFGGSLAITTPYQRVLVLSQLLDRILRLDAVIPKHETTQRIIIQYKDPDGSMHNTPPWARRYEDTYDPQQPGKPPWMDWQNQTPEQLEAARQYKLEMARKTFGLDDDQF